MHFVSIGNHHRSAPGCVLPANSTHLDCAAKCDTARGCVGYVFAQGSCAGARGGGAMCWTKGSMSNPTPQACRGSRVLVPRGSVPGHWAIKGGNAQAGSLAVYWDGKRAPGYAPMRKQGAIVLGIGGDNSGACCARGVGSAGERHGCQGPLSSAVRACACVRVCLRVCVVVVVVVGGVECCLAHDHSAREAHARAPVCPARGRAMLAARRGPNGNTEQPHALLSCRNRRLGRHVLRGRHGWLNTLQALPVTCPNQNLRKGSGLRCRLLLPTP